MSKHSEFVYRDDPIEAKTLLNKPAWTTPRNRKTWKFHAIGALLSGITLFAFVSSPLANTTRDWWTRLRGTFTSFTNDVEFEQITPSEKLEWHPCRDGLFCARLTVPMDYNRPLNESKDNPKVHLALVLSRGQHDPDSPSVSPLLVNPGGPGGSGTMLVTAAGRALQALAGPQLDLIGFDPRGVGATTPRADCFSPDYITDLPRNDTFNFDARDWIEGLYRRLNWQLMGREIGLGNETSQSIARADRRNRLVGKLCQNRDALDDENSIFRHISTPTVARDMISIIDAWDEWRESTAKKASISEQEQTTEDSKYSLDTKGKLVYWGFSYGTLLGATFAALFPDRVGRVILDGVVDADHYVAPMWIESIVDSDAIFRSFPKYCFEGKSECALFKEGDTLKDIEDRFWEVQANLKEKPFEFITLRQSAMSFTYDDFKMMAFQVLYNPTHNGFKMLASIIDALARGQTQLIEYLEFTIPKEFYRYNWPEWLLPGDAQAGIMCSDKRYPLNDTLAGIEKKFEKMSKLSSFADIWFGLMLGCEGWDIQSIDPPMRWGKHPVHKEKPINTSFPVLFLSNTYDPVTPLRAGLKMALKFADSGLLEQQSLGHCTLAAFSRCTITKIRGYFHEGKVPPHPVPAGKDSKGDWEVCAADEWPFKPFQGAYILNGEYEDISKAAKIVQDHLSESFTLNHNRKLGKTNFDIFMGKGKDAPNLERARGEFWV